MFIAHQQSLWRILRFVYALERIALHQIEHGPLPTVRVNFDATWGPPFQTFQ